MDRFYSSPVFFQLREIFSRSIDSGWFAVIAENSALVFGNVRLIRDFVYHQPGQSCTADEAADRLNDLEDLIRKTLEHIIPVIKEKLQISSLAPDDMVKNLDERLLRRFVAYTLPHNLKELMRLIDLIRLELKTACPLVAEA